MIIAIFAMIAAVLIINVLLIYFLHRDFCNRCDIITKDYNAKIESMRNEDSATDRKIENLREQIYNSIYSTYESLRKEFVHKTEGDNAYYKRM